MGKYYHISYLGLLDCRDWRAGQVVLQITDATGGWIDGETVLGLSSACVKIGALETAIRTPNGDRSRLGPNKTHLRCRHMAGGLMLPMLPVQPRHIAPTTVFLGHLRLVRNGDGDDGYSFGLHR